VFPFCVFSEGSLASVMIYMISFTAEELTFESHFLSFIYFVIFLQRKQFVSISFKNLGSSRFLSFSEMTATDFRIFAWFPVSPPKKEVCLTLDVILRFYIGLHVNAL